MAKNKYTSRKRSTAEIVFAILSILLVLSMVLAAVVSF